jgi:NADH:ubiquinone oxidoreductase subunit E
MDIGATVEETVERVGKRSDMVIEILHELQTQFHYLPEAALRKVSEMLEMPLSQVYSIATFYNAFSLRPRGRHKVGVCMGTPCHVKGAPRIIEAIERAYNVKVGGTDPKGDFTLETTGCVGTCGLAPVVMIDDEEMFGKVTQSSIVKILEQYKKK